MPKHKRFIDPKRSITFVLGSRDQTDPLITDETAPQRVLIPVERRKDEQKKYGVYFDDDYDYLKHIKTLEEVEEMTWDKIQKGQKGERSRRGKKDPPKETEQEETLQSLMLPSSVFQSEVKEKIGMLNKAAPISGPRLDLDPDIVAGMDDDFDYDDPENQLEDDFMQLAEGPASSESESDEEFEVEMCECSEDDDFFDEEADMKEETKSRFTNYSMTSSVIRRNAALQLHDEMFEKVYEEYDVKKADMFDPFDMAAMEDYHEMLDEDFTQTKALENMIEDTDSYAGKKALLPLELTDDQEVKEKIKNTDFDKSEEVEEVIVEEPAEKWDCESILSTYSNLYNHPKIIRAPSKKKLTPIEISEKSGIPKGVLGRNKLTAKNLASLGQEEKEDVDWEYTSTVGSNLTMPSTIRIKDETPEDKKTRKSALKMYQRERRQEKKANTLAFKDEKLNQNRNMMNIQNNLQGMQLA